MKKVKEVKVRYAERIRCNKCGRTGSHQVLYPDGNPIRVDVDGKWLCTLYECTHCGGKREVGKEIKPKRIV